MKKTVLILGVLLFCVQVGYAQTPCEKTFSNARQLFVQNNYKEAKTQFQKVVNNCDSNKEIAQEYIWLCEGYLRLTEQQQNQNRADKSTIDTLNRIISRRDDRIRRLEKDSIPFYANLLIKAKAENDSLREVTNEQQQFMDSYENEKKVLYGSLRDVGKELNDYLDGKLGKDGKKEIKVICDTTSNDSVVSFMRDNVRLVKKIKTSLFK